MNILIIDTAQTKCSVGFYGGQKLDLLSWQWRHDTGSELIKRIHQILSKHSLKLTDLDSIIVNRGPGSYTGIRVGMVVANTLAWSLKLNIIGQSFPQDRPVSGEDIQKIIDHKNFSNHFPTPIY